MYRTVFLKNSFLLYVMCTLCSCNKPTNRLPYYNTADFTPVFIQHPEDVKNITHTIGAFNCLDQNGLHISEKTVEGKIHVADFFFTSCGSICPKLTDNMSRINDVFSTDTNIVLLSYSVTPWIDSVSRLNTYAAGHHITNPNWHLLTGNKSEIYTLARRSYFAEEKLGFTKDSSDFLHTEHFILVDKQQHIRGIYNGTLEFEMEQLISDIKELEKEL